MEILLLLLQLFTVTFVSVPATHQPHPLSTGKQIFCYYSSFAQTRKGIGKFLPENINPHLCTHVIYAFVDITSDGRGLRPFNKNDLGKNGLYARTLALKKSNPALKILLAVGGWQIGSRPFVPMIKDENTRATWIKNVVKYLRKRGFDGLDMDWEFPATRGSQPGDKYKFTALMKGWPLQQTARLASSANGKVGLFSTQQGWPLQQAARLASSANSRVGLFSSSKVGLFSKRLGWPPQQTVTLATSATIGLATSANSNVGHFSKQ
ncbi:hypothetical protein Btru_072452 [Bulinus truncatus]|nr:hypothetical protein Btru_072452 [Bulinus truncatus]